MSRRKNVWLALGLAGLAYYFFKMSSEDKQKIKDAFNKYGSQALDKIPEDLKRKLGLKKEDTAV